MDITLWLGYLAAVSVLSLSPGPGAVMAMELGTQQRLSQTFVGILGLQLGVASNIIVAGISIIFIIDAQPWLLVPFKWIGGGYFILIGMRRGAKFLAAASSTALPVTTSVVTLKKDTVSVMDSFVVNATNVKGIMFLLALLPQFLSQDQLMTKQLLVLGVTTIVVDFMAMSGYAVFARYVLATMRIGSGVPWNQALFGVIYLACGVAIIVL